MILVAGLVFAGVFVGWIVGHYATPGHTKTVTVAAGGARRRDPGGDREGAELLGCGFECVAEGWLADGGWQPDAGALFAARPDRHRRTSRS